MRPWALLVVALGCAPPSVPSGIDASGMKTLVLAGEALGSRVIVHDLREGFDAFAAPRGPTTAFLFAEDRERLRLDAEEISASKLPVCSHDELSPDEADRVLCSAGGDFAACEDPVELWLQQTPYFGPGCLRWSADPGARLGFYVVDLVGTGVVALELSPGRVLVGQHVLAVGRRYHTAFAVLDGANPSLAAIEQTPTSTVPDTVTRGVRIDERTVWLATDLGRLGRYDVANSTVSWVIENNLAHGFIQDIAMSPTDPEDVIAATSRCAVLRRSGGEWRVLVPALSNDTFALPVDQELCRPRLWWDVPDEVLAVGLAAGEAPRVLEELIRAQQRIHRITTSGVRVDPLPWPSDLKFGVTTGVGTYEVDDTRVLVVAGVAANDQDVNGVIAGNIESRGIWFVLDPRAGATWSRIDEDTVKTRPIQRMIRWGDGLLSTGGYTQAFSDRHWRAVPEAALSARVTVPFLQVSEFNDVAPDGHDGLIFAGKSGGGGGAPFTWRIPR